MPVIFPTLAQGPPKERPASVTDTWPPPPPLIRSKCAYCGRPLERGKQCQGCGGWIAVSLALLASLLLSGCTIAPHGSRTTHKVWTYQGRTDGLVRVERWTDRSAGGGMLLLMDPQLQNVALFHTNSLMQTGGWLTLGNAGITVDPQTGAIIGAVGSAVGNVVGAALKTAVKP